MRLLDMYCCAGGAGVGYARAGFDVTGVDLVRHDRNPHQVIEADCLSLDPAWIAANFDAVHASPKCQGQTRMRPNRKTHVNQIPDTIRLLRRRTLDSGERRGRRTWMPGYHALRHDVRAWCAGMRIAPASPVHRQFPAPDTRIVPAPEAPSSASMAACAPPIRQAWRPWNRDIWEGGHGAAASEAMGIDWMTLAEMSEAIPPAYTEFLGHQLAAQVRQRRRTAA